MKRNKNQVRRKHLRPRFHLRSPTKYFTRWHRSSPAYCCTMTQLQQLSHPPALPTTAVYTQQILKGKKKAENVCFYSSRGKTELNMEREGNNASHLKIICALKWALSFCPELICRGQQQVFSLVSSRIRKEVRISV